MSVYTKTGDRGETSLFDGSRVGKSNKRIDLLGYLDEVNSFVGVLRSCVGEKNSELDFLHEVQALLLDIGAEVANPKVSSEKYKDFDKNAKNLEERIDEMDKSLDPLYNFILPGGSMAASYAHVCRTKIRKCERIFFELRRDIILNDSIGRFLNRLSDYFFVLARKLNKDQGVDDIAWNPNIGLGI